MELPDPGIQRPEADYAQGLVRMTRGLVCHGRSRDRTL